MEPSGREIMVEENRNREKTRRTPAVFLDRDGTIIEDPGYLDDPEGVRILPGAAEAIRKLREAGYKIVCVSNQSGVARGLFTEERVHEINARLQVLLREEKTEIDAIYFCPHHPDCGEPPYRRACRCRKPAPGMVKKAEGEHFIDLERSFMIGDSLVDVLTGRAAGLETILVMTGQGRKEKHRIERAPEEKPDFEARDILEAANIILK